MQNSPNWNRIRFLFAALDIFENGDGRGQILIFSSFQTNITIFICTTSNKRFEVEYDNFVKSGWLSHPISERKKWINIMRRQRLQQIKFNDNFSFVYCVMVCFFCCCFLTLPSLTLAPSLCRIFVFARSHIWTIFGTYVFRIVHFQRNHFVTPQSHQYILNSIRRKL